MEYLVLYCDRIEDTYHYSNSNGIELQDIFSNLPGYIPNATKELYPLQYSTKAYSFQEALNMICELLNIKLISCCRNHEHDFHYHTLIFEVLPESTNTI